MNTDTAGNRPLRSVFLDSKINLYSNKELVDMIMYGADDVWIMKELYPILCCTRNITRRGVSTLHDHCMCKQKIIGVYIWLHEEFCARYVPSFS
ncbi:hypothetical protein TNCV_3476581 [Trichonephila clavipes]|nr:hypothetical protein TNCV_3476581 [Trichonephila clavipes]